MGGAHAQLRGKGRGSAGVPPPCTAWEGGSSGHVGLGTAWAFLVGIHEATGQGLWWREGPGQQGALASCEAVNAVSPNGYTSVFLRARWKERSLVLGWVTNGKIKDAPRGLHV